MPFDAARYASQLLRGEAPDQSLSAPAPPQTAPLYLDDEWIRRVVSLGLSPEQAREHRDRINAQTEKFREFARQESGAGDNAARVRDWRQRNPDENRARNAEYQRAYRARAKKSQEPTG